MKTHYISPAFVHVSRVLILCLAASLIAMVILSWVGGIYMPLLTSGPLFFGVIAGAMLISFFFICRWSARRLARKGYSSVGNMVAIVSGILTLIITWTLPNYFFYSIALSRHDLSSWHPFAIPGILLDLAVAIFMYWVTRKYIR